MNTVDIIKINRRRHDTSDSVTFVIFTAVESQTLNLNNLSIFMKTYGDFREKNLFQVCGDHVLSMVNLNNNGILKDD